MISPVVAVFQDGAGRLTASEVHDTIAAIVRQPEYATPLRQSLAGRVFRYVVQRVADFIELFQGSPTSRVIVISALVLIGIVIVARVVVLRRIDAEARRTGDDRTAGGGTRRDAWAEARDRASAGDYEAATHALYSAVIDSLARTGAIKHHPSKTSGDYVREMIRRGAPTSREFRAFVRDADRVIFGNLRPSAEDYERLASAAMRVVGASIAA